jgi:hypothetical protein
VKAELEKSRAALRAETHFDLMAAFAGFDEAIAFAKETGNATALVRGYEMKSKLAGLLDQRDQTTAAAFQINIGGLEPRAPLPIVEVKAATPIARDDSDDDTA